MTPAQKNALTQIDSIIESVIQKPTTMAQNFEFLDELETLIEATRESLNEDKKREETAG